jgi:hypothetical protein
MISRENNSNWYKFLLVIAFRFLVLITLTVLGTRLPLSKKCSIISKEKGGSLRVETQEGAYAKFVTRLAIGPL